jgi:NAD(P)-dependent dehydrogenase (short-subunit alcohol dehydrogenase family)
MSEPKKVKELVNLEGKVAIITGGASGIGLASAKRLAETGATIALCDINESKGKEALSEIKALGTEARFYLCDVTSNADCRRTVDQIFEDFGRIDILFNNAGIIWRKSVTELTEDEWDAVLDVNLKAVFLFSRYVIPLMEKSGKGSIINAGSGWGLKGGVKAAAYCAAKGGVVNLTRAMAIDHGKEGIRVNCICPGDTDTELLREEAVQLGLPEKEFMRDAADRPLQRLGLPEDIANAVLFFASDLSSWVTGSTLVVDGGGIA